MTGVPLLVILWPHMMTKKMTNFGHLFVVLIMSCKISLYFGI